MRGASLATCDLEAYCVKEFPADWPESCPPPQASSPSGTVYRIVKQAALDDKEFLSYIETKKPFKGDKCLAHGLSVFAEKSHAIHYAELMPYLGKLIAHGDLQSHHGKILATPRKQRGIDLSHKTWWPYPEVDRKSIFSVP